MQHHADGDRWRREVHALFPMRKVHALFPDYERDARLVPTFTRAGLGGCYNNGGAEEELRIGKLPECLLGTDAPTRRAGGGVAATRAPRRKGAPDGRKARPGSTIVIRGTEGVLQTPADEGWRREAPPPSPGCCRDARFVPTMDIRRAAGVLQRAGR